MRKLYLTLAFAALYLLVAGQAGSLDNSFSGDGKITGLTGFGQAIAIQSDGKVIVAATINADFAVIRYNSDGSIDLNFGTNGIAVTDINGSDVVNAVALQSDGKIVVAGYTSWPGKGSQFAVARFNSNGTLDQSFDGDGKVLTPILDGGQAFSMVIQSDGKIVVVGLTNDPNINFYFGIVRYNTDGSLDASFDNDGIVTTGFRVMPYSDDNGLAVAIQTDGKIVVAGNSGNGTNYDFAVARYNTNGSLDASFDGDGKVLTSFGTASHYMSIAIQNDGKIVVAGDSNSGSTNSSSIYNFAVARYNPDGSLDTGFDGDGKYTTNFGTSTNQAYSLALQNDGKILVAGMASNGSNSDFALLRLNTDGSPDASFDSDGKVLTDFAGSNDEARAMQIYGNRIYLAGGSNRTTTPVIDLAVYSNDATSQFVINQTPGNYEVVGASAPVLTGTNFTRLEKPNGELIAEINPNNNNLGQTSWGENVYSGTDVRAVNGWFGLGFKQTGGFMGRSIYVSPSAQPSSSVTLRIYCTQQEIDAFLTSFNSQYGTSKTINDIRIIKYSGPNVDLDWSNNSDISSDYVSIAPSFIGSYGETQDMKFFEFPVSSFSEFWLALTVSGSSLPVTLISFAASVDNNKVELKWSTSYEYNAAQFLVERSFNGTDFSTIGSVAANNNSYTVKNYSFMDGATLQGTLFYRLKIIDADGSFKYSRVVAVKTDAVAKQIYLFPNPAIEVLHVQLSEVRGSAKWEIADVNGKVVRQESFQTNGAYAFSINVQALARGTYYLIIHAPNFKKVQSFIKK